MVVQDGFLTETAEFADVVLPAAIWGEKTGTFTNVDRTVHISRQGRRPAGRGPLRPRHLPRLRPPDGLPRPGRRPADPWHDPETAFEAWKAVLRAAARATTPA